MDTEKISTITVQVRVSLPVEKVWELWTTPDHIINWNNASDDWHTPHAKHDLRPGGEFLFRMEAKDGSFGFDFGGVYDTIKTNEMISYTLGDGRKVEILFKSMGPETEIVETFEAESENPVKMQHDGWQAILNNFKKYAESEIN